MNNGEWTLDDLKQLVENGRFHHATARTIGSPRIWIYAVDPNGFRGYVLVASLADSDEVHTYMRSINHGISIGAYGAG